MALIDEIRQQNKTGSFGGTDSYTPQTQRKSLLQEIVGTDGTDGLNKAYVDYALNNGGGFGASYGGLVKKENGDTAPAYDYSSGKSKGLFGKLKDWWNGNNKNGTDYGKALQGAWYKGGDEFTTQITSSLDFLLGDAAQELWTLGEKTVNDIITPFGAKEVDWGDNPITAWNKKAQANKQQNIDYFADNASTSKAAQIIDKFGTTTVAAVPMAVEALLTSWATLPTAAASTLTSGLNYISALNRSGKAGQLGLITKNNIAKLLNDPNFWTSYLQVLGTGYDDAKADGFNDEDAALYAMGNGAISSIIEIGGADDALGGLQQLAKARGNKTTFLDWLKGSVLGEGLEEVEQGAFERGLKSFFGASPDIVSFDPQNTSAIFNPYTAGEEFLGGAVAGGILGGVNAGINNTVNRANEAKRRKSDNAFINDAISKLGLKDAEAGVIRSGYETGTASAESYTRGVEEAYKYGKNGASVKTMNEGGQFVNELTLPQKQNAYNLGRIAAGLSTVKLTDTTNAGTQGKAVTEAQRAAVNEAESATGNNPPTETLAPTVEPTQTDLREDTLLSAAQEAVQRAETQREAPTAAPSQPSPLSTAQGETAPMAEESREDSYKDGVEAAYNIGVSNLPESYLDRIESIGTEEKKAAFDRGRTAMKEYSAKMAEGVKASDKGGSRNRVGTVKGRDVKLADLRKEFNDEQRVMYRLLSDYAKVTGLDVVLYRDSSNEIADGYYKDNAVYINIDAGAYGKKSVKELGRYTAMRSFAHEFTHFIEKWNFEGYNELRGFVFNYMTGKGVDVDGAIREYMKLDSSLSYESASREIVAEGLVDILPQSDIVQRLANEHKTVYQKLIEKLKEFTARLKSYYKSLTVPTTPEAQALKDGIEYAESIVRLWTDAGVKAARNYKAATGAEVVSKNDRTTPEKETVRENRTVKKSDAEPVIRYNEEETKLYNALRVAGTYSANGYMFRYTQYDGIDYASIEQGNKTIAAYRDEGGHYAALHELMGYVKDNNLLENQNGQKGETKPIGRDYFPPNDFTSQAEEAPRLRDMVQEAVSEKSAGTPEEQGNGGNSGLSANAKQFINILASEIINSAKSKNIQVSGYYNATKDFNAFDITHEQYITLINALAPIVEEINDSKATAYLDAIKETAGITDEELNASKPTENDITTGKQLADYLHGYIHATVNGIEYSITSMPNGKGGDEYLGVIKRVPKTIGGIPVENARDTIFKRYFNSYEEAADYIADVAENNNLLKKKETAATPTEAAPKNVAKQPEAVYSDSIAAWKNGTPSEKLAYMILTEHLKTGKGMPSKALYAMADKAFGGTQAQGAYNRKDAYDAMELAVNRYILDTMKEYNEGTVENAVKGIEAAQHILSLLPTQNVRTDEQEKFQQFSTPPSIAYIAAWTANITKADHILEPSAGIGGIASFAKAWGATVTVNELSKRRLGILRSMGFDNVFNENAEQIDNVLPDNIQPTVVLMNPPFSATAGRTETNKTSNAERHIDQALERLSDGGRLIAIVGRGMSNDKYSKYWNRVRQRYNIRANIGVDGSNYTKYGTSFDIQIVVIDKTGAQGSAKTVTGSFKELSDIPKVLEGIRNDRNTEIKPVSDLADVQAAPSEPIGKPAVSAPVDSGNTGASGNGVQNGSAKLDNGQNGKRPVGSGTERAGGSKSNVQATDTVKSGAVQQQRDNGTVEAASKASERSGGLERPENDGDSGRTSTDVGRQSVEQRSIEEEAVSDDGVFSTYTPPTVPIKGAGKHPATLVESAAMAAVNMPKATYVPSLPADVIKNNLSDAQVVSVVYAGQAHEQKLPSGERKGFFIGDGTGVGKGRQISGIILDNFLQGRKKAVWISEKADLINDAQRDWTQTSGRSGKEVFALNKTNIKEPVKEMDGILYTTYDTLKSKGKAENESRIKQIVDWFGKDYDGVIVFDEAHNMGHLFAEGFGKGGSQKAAAGVELQRKLPNARIVYVSATAATEVEGLAFASRLGLWGKGTAFNDLHDFVAKIGSSGLSAMELVVRDMKAMGLYVARSISYNGVEYNTVQHDLTPDQNIIYDTLSRAWQSTLKAANQALSSTGAIYNAEARRRVSQYFGAMQRFYNQVLTSMSMPSVIADIRKQLAEGKSCVIQVVNTNQAQADRQISKLKGEERDLDDLDLTPRDTLINYITDYFPIQEYEEYLDDNGKTASRPVTDGSGKPVISKAALKERERLIAVVNDMAVPDGPFEMLYNAFGTDMVAEVTGRKRRIVPKRMPDGSIKRVEEQRKGDYKTADINAFQEGKKRILIFNDAGGTGKSYHADLRAKNQQQRVHYVLQPGWQASKAVQGFGRTHRSNEASAPIYKLVTTNIKGQKRFTSTIARRLDQLGALTKGQRDTGSGMFGAADNLETALAGDALRRFYENLVQGRIEGLDAEKVLTNLGLIDSRNATIKDADARDIPKFLNRILVLEVSEQNKVFDEFLNIYTSMIEKAIKDGTLDRGMENVKADKIDIIDDKVINKQKETGAETHYVQAKTYTKPVVFKSVKAAKNSRSVGFLGLYRTTSGAVRAVFRIADETDDRGRVLKQYKLQTPNAKRSSTYGETNFKKLEAIPEKDWESAWAEEVKKVPEYNEETVHMLTGSLLPIWSALPQEGYTKVQRLIADNGDMYLGRVLTTEQIDKVLKRFDLQRKHENISANDVFEKAVKRGLTFYLTDNRAKLFRSRVSREWRLEYSQQGNTWSILRNYPDMISEEIQYRTRYFVPDSAEGRRMLENILANNPVVSTSEETNEDDVRYQLKRVPPVQPTTNEWKRTKDTDEALKIFPNMWNVTAEESESRNPTQIASTVGTYRKIYNILKAEGFNGTILDASSGLGIGTKVGREEYGFDIEDIEPYPGTGYIPMYKDYSALGKKYDVIISSAVLNVLPQDQRDALVVKMGEMLNAGGRIFITTRGKDVETLAKTGANIHLGSMEWIETVKGSYQKGFTNAELVAYLRDALGNGFNVVPASRETGGRFNNNTSVVVTKLNDGQNQLKRVPPVQPTTSERDSEGRELSEGQQEFFRGSKVRDEDGNLLVMYHGTNNEFTVFAPAGNENFNSRSVANWFVDSEKIAKTYAPSGKTMRLYLNIKKPLVIDAKGKWHYQVEYRGNKGTQRIAEMAKRRGYDGVIFKNIRDYSAWYSSYGTATVAATFDSKQSKFADNLEPTEDEDIRYQYKRDYVRSDRELLELAADLVEKESEAPDKKTVKYFHLTDGQKEALRIFRERLDRLRQLQEEREELSDELKAMFKKGGSRSGEAETRNRISVLDSKITALENLILSMEDKQVLKEILQKAKVQLANDALKGKTEALEQYRESRKERERLVKYRARVEKNAVRLLDMLVKPNNKNIRKRVPAAIAKSVADFVSSINFTSKRLSRGGEATKRDLSFAKKMQAVHDSIKENIDARGEYSGYADLPPNFMEQFEDQIKTVTDYAEDNSGDFVFNRMNADQLKQLNETLKQLRHYILSMNEFLDNAAFIHTEDAAMNSIEHMKPISRAVSKNGVVRDYFRRFLSWEYMRPSTAFERFGEGGVSICNEFKEGQSTQAFLIDKLLKFRKATYTTDEVKKWSEDTVTVELDEQDEDGERVKVTMPVAMAMSFYCLNRREQGRGHIYGDGITIAAYEKGGKTVRDEGHLITAEDAKRIENALTDRQIEVCKAIQRFMSTECSVWGNYVTLKRWGTKVFSEEFYFPINTDGRYLPAQADGTPSNAALYALLNMGFTKELQQGAKNRIMIYNIFDVFVNHASQMTQYRSFALPVLDCLKWLNFRDGETTLRGEMRKAYGAKADKAGSSNMGYAESFVVNLLKAYNGTTARGDNFDIRGIKALHRFNRAAVGFNARVVIQQPLAVTRAAMYINPAYLTEGLAHSAAGLKKLAEEMEAHSGIALLKRQGFYDTNISRGLEDLLKNGEEAVLNPAKKEFWSGDNITDIGLKGAELADRYTWAAMWYAAKKTVKRSEHKTEEEYFKAVTDVFENVIYKSQVVDSVMTKSEFLRSQSYFPRMMGAFMSEASATVSQLMEAVNRYGDDLARGKSSREAWQDNKDFFRKTFIVYGVGQVILAAVQSVADAWRDDDDYETFLQKYLEALGKNVANDLIPFSNLPYLSDLFELAKTLLNKAGFKNVYGYTNSEGWLQYGEYLYKSIEIFHGINTGDTRMKYTVWGGIYNLLRGVAGLTGYPIATLSREVIDVWNNVVGSFDASKKIKTYDAGAKSNIRYAYLDGYLAQDEAVQKLVESGEADDKNDAYLTVHQWDTDSSSIYDAVVEAAENGDTAMFREERDFLTVHGKTVKDIQNALKTRVRNSYLAGDYSASQAQSILSKFAGDSAEDARARMANWDFSENNPSLGWEYATIQTYLDEMKPAGISTKVYDRYLEGYKKCKGTDADGDGKTDSGSKKAEVLALIDSLDLTPEQKDVLYYKNNYAANKIYEAPWH